MIQLSAIATAVFGQWHPAGDLALPRIGMPAFDALAGSVLRCQQAGGARATEDRRGNCSRPWSRAGKYTDHPVRRRVRLPPRQLGCRAYQRVGARLFGRWRGISAVLVWPIR